VKLSLVIPCYNEVLNLPLLLERCADFPVSAGVEVILVDNGSTDNTAQVLLDLLPKYSGCRSVRVELNQGYGFGILSGLRAAKGEILAWTHADMQTDPLDVLKGLVFFEQHGDKAFVKGRRYGRPITDVFFTIGMSLFESILLRKGMWDINAQPVMFSRSFFEGWTDAPTDFSLDLYTYFNAKNKGLRVCRFPVRFGERAHGESHWNVNWNAKWKFIQRTVSFSLRLRKGLSQK